MENISVIDREKLKKWIDEKKDFVLVDVLLQISYDEHRIPGAVHAGVHEDGFLEKVAGFVLDKTKTTVVYCSSFHCQASVIAAKRLGEAGYTDVYHFAGGLADWQDAGYALEEGEPKN